MKKLTILISIFIFSTLLDAKACKELKSCEEACKYYLAGESKLDRDKDGVPCESLCKAPCEKPEEDKQEEASKDTNSSRK